MPDDAGDILAELTTAPIFDDAVYLSEVLELPANETEDDLEARLAALARKAGIEDPYRFLCAETQQTAIEDSATSASSAHRSSLSLYSRDTQSTGVTSHLSRASRDLPGPPLEGVLTIRASSHAPRSSFSSLDYYDSMMERFRSNARHQSSASAPDAIPYGSSVSPKLAPRKLKRASGLFSIFRKDSSTCSSRSHHSHHSRSASVQLECGHTLSRYAVQVHIKDALDTKDQITPNCCGKPLPTSVLETVLTQEEASILATSGSSTTNSPQDSGYSEDGASSIELSGTQIPSRAAHSTFRNPNPFSEAHSEPDAEFSKAFMDEGFKDLRNRQREQYRRVASFEAHQRQALSAYHKWTIKRLTVQFKANHAAMVREHGLQLERLEESQVVAEHDLRRAQIQETQNVATALKYMEAYCSGKNPANPSLAHTVTDEDRKKLARQHVTQQKLPAKHKSAINVLRARQEKDMKIKLEKQKEGLRQLKLSYEQQKRDEETQHLNDLSRLDALIQARRRRMMHQWDLRYETWRCTWEKQNETSLNRRIPQEAFPERMDDTASSKSSSPSSLALYLQIMV
ncbi:uncharacterized protein EI97DRAFT_451300 [Westerdykella ornata]|uniref:Uncharacterized protein n=1 Tax=Westerdykella ornata TaxID=318751 RepID=A0A6A6JFG9_WESOR|nr:uncharacterized protein EI97DRAFT_451300 [Westerdykella ornata]KAF2275077.1 hypothetical protein EI97DRAFT_451300 [Westerdykella ornata]